MAEENSNKRIARNTILLYTRSLINLVIGLYTSRLTLDALGIPDYGIYNVVGSLVALFGLFNGSLNTAISRFITYELGRNNNPKAEQGFFLLPEHPLHFCPGDIHPGRNRGAVGN